MVEFDDVGEHHRRQDAVDLGFAARSGKELFDLSDDAVNDVGLEQRDMIFSRQFNVLGALNGVCEITSALDDHRVVFGPVED